MSEETKRFSCLKCGGYFDAYPPDDMYVITSIEKREGECDFIERKYKCTNYNEKNIIY